MQLLFFKHALAQMLKEKKIMPVEEALKMIRPVILFRKMGMTRGKLLGICMCEALRESLWCIVTLPLMLILEVLIYSSNIRKL